MDIVEVAAAAEGRQPAGPEGPASDLIAEARGVHRIYETGRVSVHALNGLDLAIARGEMVAIMGPSGCGKTTLLNCLSGLDAIDGGDVLIEGVSLAVDVATRAHRLPRPADGLRLPVLQPDARPDARSRTSSCRCSSRACPPSEARRRALEALELVGLADRARTFPTSSRADSASASTIARALVNDPAIVWADEPTGDLDSENAEEIVELDAPAEPRARALVPDRHPRHRGRPRRPTGSCGWSTGRVVDEGHWPPSRAGPARK